MSVSMAQELAGLHRLTVPELRARYVQAFGAAPPSHHKTWLRKRLAWRLQAAAEGDLSQRACVRAALLAQDIVWRLAPPNDAAPQAPTPKDRNPAEHTPVVGSAMPATTKATGKDPARRQPLPGTLLTRTYKGQTLAVEVLAEGFRWQGRFFKSLSAVAKTITGQHCSGFYFFRNAKESS